MIYTVKGLVIAIGEVKETKRGVKLQHVHVEQENSSKIFYPTAMGDKMDLLEDLLPGDVVKVDFMISGRSGIYNNVIIDNIVRI